MPLLSHIELVNEAKEAINKVFGDSSVDKETTRESLEELRELIDENLDAL